MKSLFDRLALFYIRRRLACFQSQADAADRFADRIVLLLRDEIGRRNRLFDKWDVKRQREIEKSVDDARREMAQERFEQLQ